MGSTKESCVHSLTTLHYHVCWGLIMALDNYLPKFKQEDREYACNHRRATITSVACRIIDWLLRVLFMLLTTRLIVAWVQRCSLCSLFALEQWITAHMEIH